MKDQNNQTSMIFPIKLSTQLRSKSKLSLASSSKFSRSMSEKEIEEGRIGSSLASISGFDDEV